MKNFLKLLLLIPFLACNTPTKNQHNPDFEGLLADYFDGTLELYRINATFLGDTRYNDTLPNYLSPAFKTKEKDFLVHYKERLETFDADQLSHNQLLSKNILLRELDLELEGKTFVPLSILEEKINHWIQIHS